MTIKKIDSSRFVVNISQSILGKKDWVKYLVLVDWHAKELAEQLKHPVEAGFEKFLTEQLDSYLAGKQPPADISTAILNIADQHLSGTDITLRTGDYIALQKHFRAAK